jgi:hypothetical protein
MRIVNVEVVEECLEGTLAVRYTFDVAWTCEAIARLESIGTVEYFPEFPRPFFRVHTDLGADVRGVEASRTCRVVLPRSGSSEARRAFETCFQSTNGPVQALDGPN